jgi:hypothetical protein
MLAWRFDATTHVSIQSVLILEDRDWRGRITNLLLISAFCYDADRGVCLQNLICAEAAPKVCYIAFCTC